MANIKEYIKKVMDGTVSLEEQQAALAQVEKTIVEAKQRRDESVGQKADMVVQALKTIEAKLEAKLVELNNTPAMQGVQGPTGKAGKDGVDGKDGINGVSGKDGKDGKNGVDGKDGISVVDAKIDFDGSLVVYLSDGNEIDCGQILSPDVAQNIIINSGGSGTSQTVTDTLVSLQNQIDTLTGIDGELGDMAQQNANAVAITGGTINGTTIGATTPSTGKFSTLEATGNSTLGTGSSQYIQVEGGATAVLLSAQGAGTNIPLALQPKGTGAIQAQATTSTTAGGNARGANAVDWQTVRGVAGQVASGLDSTVSGGERNTASGAYSSVGGGYLNTANNSFASSLSGNGNTSSGILSTTVGGNTNTAAGYFNFIGGGFTNSATANAAVTTQSGTMNATTAVTLSGSNANIKVGQLITGTSIALYTYVAAISGTSLTLSQNASGSSTSTLSFFTPHGVVVGGGNNQATGSYSFIGGGGDAGTAANRNSAAGDWSSVVGGFKNTIASTSTYSVIAGGFNSSITGNGYSFLGGGILHSISSDYASILGGYQNSANGRFSSVLGGGIGITRSIAGNQVSPASFNPLNTGLSGQVQSAVLVLARQTTDATPTVLCSNSSAAGTTNQVILPNNSAYFFRGEVVSGKTAAGDTKGWTIEGVIKRGANAASTALVGIPTVTSTYADLGAATWDIAVTADTTNGGIRVTFTGQAATTIRTVCQIRTTEMTF
jgi:hypothetical protein